MKKSGLIIQPGVTGALGPDAMPNVVEVEKVENGGVIVHHHLKEVACAPQSTISQQKKSSTLKCAMLSSVQVS